MVGSAETGSLYWRPSLPFGKLLLVSVKPSSVVDQVCFPLVKKKTDLAFQPFTEAWIGAFHGARG